MPEAALARPKAYRLPPGQRSALEVLERAIARALPASPRLAPLLAQAERELAELAPAARERALVALGRPARAAETLLARRLGYALALRLALAARLSAKGRMASWQAFSEAPQAQAGAFLAAELWRDQGLDEATYPWPEWAAFSATEWAALQTLARGAHELPGPQDLYLTLFPKALRHAAGEYYTPPWLAAHLLDLAAYDGAESLLDPTCGSGVFIVEALLRHVACKLAEGQAPETIVAALPATIAGIDNNPLAVLAARAACLLALPPALLSPFLKARAPLIHEGDVLLAPPELGTFAQVVGNPPWVAYDSLAPELRQRLRPIWEGFGLFPKIGFEAILGRGKKDLSLLISYAVTARYLAPGGRLSFLITRAAFKSAGAAASFRRFCLTPDGPGDLEMLGVEDWSQWPLFFGATTQTVLFSWRRGAPTRYPLPYLRREQNDPAGSLPQALSARPTIATDPCSPWLSHTPQHAARLARLCAPSAYRAFEGANSGGANGIFWLEILRRSADGELLLVRNLAECGKRAARPFEGWLEARHIYPLLRARDLRPFAASPGAAILLLQDPQTRRGLDPARLERDAPNTFAYISAYAPELLARAAFTRYFTSPNGAPRAPFYSMFNVSEATFAPYKVVYNRVGTGLTAAALGPLNGRPVIPQETLCLVPCADADEAFYLLGFLQSGPLEELLNAYSQCGGKGYAGPHLFKQGAIARFDAANSAHQELAASARACARSAEITPALKERVLAAALAAWGIVP